MVETGSVGHTRKTEAEANGAVQSGRLGSFIQGFPSRFLSREITSYEDMVKFRSSLITGERGLERNHISGNCQLTLR